MSAIAQHNDSYSSDADKYNKVINNAIEAYNLGHTDILETIVTFFADPHIHNYKFHKISILFFEKTKTKPNIFVRLANMDLELKTYHTISLMEAIADSDCYLSLLTLYKNGNLHYQKIIEALAYRMREDSEIYNNIHEYQILRK
mgnify:CR=1 FL=1